MDGRGLSRSSWTPTQTSWLSKMKWETTMGGDRGDYDVMSSASLSTKDIILIVVGVTVSFFVQY